METVLPSPELFDGQAAQFDERAGLSVTQCQRIAAAVREVSGLHATDWLLEIGAGTGQLGVWLAARGRYLGFDYSAEMLRTFRQRLAQQGGGAALLQADGNQPWPLADGCARVLFSSRALHLLDAAHVVRESFRVAHPAGATLLIGRVEREPESVRAQMAQAMRQFLRQAGYAGRGGQQRALLARFVAGGGVVSAPVPVVSWTMTASPRQSLRAWQQLPGLGGIAVPPAVRQQVLTELEAWAQTNFGSLDAVSTSTEVYFLNPVRLRPV